MLVDSFGRKHDYLRISLTDQCNFRCVYCMPHEQMEFMPKESLMQANEIYEIAKIFVFQGVKKIRLTGGEPLLRKDFGQIIEKLSTLPITLTLTSNGYLVDKYLNQLQQAGIKSINISLDSLRSGSFAEITQRNSFAKVWQNIELLLSAQFHVKINVVAMRSKNFNEILDFTALTIKYPVHVRFIEFMPFTGNEWEQNQVITQHEILEKISLHYRFQKLEDEKHDTAKAFKIEGAAGTFAIISTMSEPFCNDCNRLRLTADGKIKNCLFSAEETHLLQQWRAGNDIVPVIKYSVQMKHARQGGQIPSDFTQTQADSIINRSMISIGG